LKTTANIRKFRLMFYDTKISVVDDEISANHKKSPAHVHYKKFNKILLNCKHSKYVIVS